MELCGRVPSEPVPAAEAIAPGPYDAAWRFTAPALDSSVPRLRHAVRDLLVRTAVPLRPDTLDGLLLIASELVTNAVRHAAVCSPQLVVEVATGPRWVRIAVADDHPYRPKALACDWTSPGGRGLLLVEAIVEQAGGRTDVQHTAAGGKVVWAALPLPAVREGVTPANP